MRIPVHCTVCGSSHRSEIRDLPEARVVCPFCEHEAELPDDAELARMEHAAERQRLFTILGAGAFLLAVLLAVFYAGLSDAKAAESGMALGVLGGTGVLAILGLVLAVMAESRASGNYF